MADPFVLPLRPPKRPNPSSYSSSSTSSSSASSSSGRVPTASKRVAGIFQHWRIYVLDAKAQIYDLGKLRDMIKEGGGKLVGSTDEAEIVVSATNRWNRVLRWFSGKPPTMSIVRAEWVIESFSSGTLQPIAHYLVAPTGESAASAMPPPSGGPPPATAPVPVSADLSAQLDHRSAYAPERYHPLVCPNERFVEQLRVIKRERELDGDEVGVVSYGRAIACVKAFPKKIRRGEDLRGCGGVGEKIMALADEFLSTNRLEATERILEKESYRTRQQFARIDGIGPYRATALWNEGFRSLDGLIAAGKATERQVKLAEDFDLKIPRDEVTAIADVIVRHLRDAEPEAQCTICGGHRRGKPESNDIDIVFTHPEVDGERGLLKRLVASLQKSGFITDVLNFSDVNSRREGGGYRQSRSFDTLDKAFVVVRSCKETGTTHREQPIHRRVDLISAPCNRYWTAVLGWTGSTQFERDLRAYARKQHLRFDSGGITTRAPTREEVDLSFARSEADVLAVLGLPCVPPEGRNAD